MSYSGTYYVVETAGFSFGLFLQEQGRGDGFDSDNQEAEAYWWDKVYPNIHGWTPPGGCYYDAYIPHIKAGIAFRKMNPAPQGTTVPTVPELPQYCGSRRRQEPIVGPAQTCGWCGRDFPASATYSQRTSPACTTYYCSERCEKSDYLPDNVYPGRVVLRRMQG